MTITAPNSAVENMQGTSMPGVAEWKAIVSEFQQPSAWRATWQIFNSVGSYVLVWYFMYLTVSVSWWLTLPLAILAGGLLVRIFIIFHDCGHGSFFKSRMANDVTGFIAGVLNFTPYYHWRWEHAIHHASSGDLDRRGTGDVWTMTVKEYRSSSRWRRLGYRTVRHPLVLLFVAPFYLFVVRERFSTKGASPRDRRSVWWMNLAIATMIGGLVFAFGWKNYLLVQATVTLVGGAIGVWMFYVQHQFEDTYWERRDGWDFTAAALHGSSFYKLPAILQWFTGNIGFHHIHHLSSRIPNYNLQRCHESHSIFTSVKPITLRSSLKSLHFRLWDEENRKLVGFDRKMHRRIAAQTSATRHTSHPPGTATDHAATHESSGQSARGV
jgi:acyl-lipid omega-6 desaturase (Delta-12 desaturase)